MPHDRTLNRLNTLPNGIVREFDATYGTNAQQFDFVLFLERKQLAVAVAAGVGGELRVQEAVRARDARPGGEGCRRQAARSSTAGTILIL